MILHMLSGRKSLILIELKLRRSLSEDGRDDRRRRRRRRERRRSHIVLRRSQARLTLLSPGAMCRRHPAFVVRFRRGSRRRRRADHRWLHLPSLVPTDD
jgi:hypothetical protein